MNNRILGMLVGVTLLSSGVAASTVPVQQHVNNASLVGEARMRVLLWNVFDAALYAPDGQYDAQTPFALSLSYLRSLDGGAIVEKTIEEIQAQGVAGKATLRDWERALNDIIPDVRKGTTITGVRNATGATLFYRGDQLIGQINDPTFTQAFFDIWLGEKTSEPELRRDLLADSLS